MCDVGAEEERVVPGFDLNGNDNIFFEQSLRNWVNYAIATNEVRTIIEFIDFDIGWVPGVREKLLFNLLQLQSQFFHVNVRKENEYLTLPIMQ